MPEVSLFPRITATKNGEAIEFDKIIDSIRSGQYKEPITQLRNEIALGGNEKEISETKNTLPYFTGSGVFSIRNDKGLIRHSCKLIIDFDKLDNLDSARQFLSKDKYTEYLFLSCSGRGLAVVVNIDPDKHLDSFLFLEKYYQNNYDLTIDKSCKDISRPRFISYDPDLFSNSKYEKVEILKQSFTVDNDEGKFDFAIKLHNKKHDYVEGNRHNYLVILAYWLNKCGVDEGFAANKLITDFSNEDKTVDEISKIVTYCYKNIHDHGTFTITKNIKEAPSDYSNAINKIAHHAHGINQAGRIWNENDIIGLCEQFHLNAEIVKGIFKNVFEKNKDLFDLDNKADVIKVQVFLNKNFEIIRNSISRQTEYRIKGSQKFQLLNIHEIHRILQINKIKFSFDNLKHLLKSDFVKSYNPIQKYFSELPEWDNETDHIDNLASYVQTDNPEYWRPMFKKSFVRSIACSLGGKENRMIMTLFSPKQETGKSTFVRFLCPPNLKNYYSEAAIEIGKDCEVGLAENFIWNLDELRLESKNDQARFKAFISTSTVKIRVWYSEFYEQFDRIVNFWSTTNKVQFLLGNSNTRFLSFNVLSINHDYNNIHTGTKKIDIDKVWAQALALYSNGFDYSLNEDEKIVREKTNEGLLIDSPENDCIKKYFKKPTDKLRAQILTATEVYEKLAVLAPNVHKALNPQRVGYVLRDLGYEKKQRAGYYVGFNYKIEEGAIVMLSDELQSKPF